MLLCVFDIAPTVSAFRKVSGQYRHGVSPSFAAESDFHRALTRLLAQLRNDAGMSQGALASELGIDQAAVSRVEANHRRLTVGETFAWLEALGTPVGEATTLLQRLWVEHGSRPAGFWDEPRG